MRVAKKLIKVATAVVALTAAGGAYAQEATDTTTEAVETTTEAVETTTEAVETTTEAVETTAEAVETTTEAVETTTEAVETTTEAVETTAEAVETTAEAAEPYVLEPLESIGKPIQDGINFQTPVTEVMRDIIWVDNFLLYIITAISIFVTVLLLICAFRFSRKRNPIPATFTHNSALEIGWTLIPIIILIAIIPPSLSLLFKQQEIPTADITIKATGNQWYWTHEYVDEGFEFDSYMIGHPATLPDDAADQAYKKSPAVLAALKEAGFNDDEFLLATDTSVVVPVNKTIVVQVTGADVIHAWTIPAFGVKQDAVPGRLAQLWFKAEKEGVYFGQCSELCGKEHTYMPITVKVVSQEAYELWLASAKDEYADAGAFSAIQVASAN